MNRSKKLTKSNILKNNISKITKPTVLTMIKVNTLIADKQNLRKDLKTSLILLYVKAVTTGIIPPTHFI